MLAIGALALASALAVALVAFRVARTGSGEYRNLVWNLVLAWIPFLVALAVYDRHGRGVSWRRLALPTAVWLLFLPNAPYLVTDLKYLNEIGGAPLWFDATMVTTFACIGLLLGFASLYLMQTAAERSFGVAASGLVAFGALALSGFGVYLGRFERWNSWDVIGNPTAIAADLAAGFSDPLDYPRALGVTIALGAFLSLAYLVLYGFLRLAAVGVDERR